MFIKETSKIQTTSTSKTKKSSSSGNFASYLSSAGKSGSVAVSSISSISLNDAVLSAQIVGEEEEKEKKKHLIDRAENLIEKLEEIRNALLLGQISRDRLIEISRFVKNQKVKSDDSKLMYLIGEIELRVEVELAKLMK